MDASHSGNKLQLSIYSDFSFSSKEQFGFFQQNTINYNVKHPILIPKGAMGELTTLLVGHFYAVHFHTRATFTHLQRENTSPQILDPLPIPRVQASHCFQHTGSDYDGPCLIKECNGKSTRIGKTGFQLFYAKLLKQFKSRKLAT